MINGVQHKVFARRLFMIEHAYFLTSSGKRASAVEGKRERGKGLN